MLASRNRIDPGGTLDDAALGSATVEQGGGRVIVQDPVEASYDSMPRCALAVTEHAEIQPTGRLAAAVARSVAEQAETRPAEPAAELEAEVWGPARFRSAAPRHGPRLRRLQLP